MLISGLIISIELDAHWSFWTMALTSSNDEANEAMIRTAKIMAFIFVYINNYKNPHLILQFKYQKTNKNTT
jgi:hypothetical protein